MKTKELLQTRPDSPTIEAATLAECIEACYECAQACTSCADACLAEDADMKLTACIRVNLDCADVCQTTGRILTRLVRPTSTLQRIQVRACMEACKLCGEACEGHADAHRHCRVCARACQRCEEACAAVLHAMRTLATA